MPQAYLSAEDRARVAEESTRAATLTELYEPPSWPFDAADVIKRAMRRGRDEARAAERVHFQLAKNAFDRGRAADKRQEVLWWGFGAGYFLVYVIVFRLWYDAVRWEWSLEAGGEVTWRGTAVFLVGYAIFFAIGYWIAESPPAKRFMTTIAGDGDRWSSIGRAHSEVVLGLRNALGAADGRSLGNRPSE